MLTLSFWGKNNVFFSNTFWKSTLFSSRLSACPTRWFSSQVGTKFNSRTALGSNLKASRSQRRPVYTYQQSSGLLRISLSEFDTQHFDFCATCFHFRSSETFEITVPPLYPSPQSSDFLKRRGKGRDKKKSSHIFLFVEGPHRTTTSGWQKKEHHISGVTAGSCGFKPAI